MNYVEGVKMDDKEKNIIESYNSIMKGYETQTFVSGNWPMENGVYKQYSAFNESDNSVSGTSYKL